MDSQAAASMLPIIAEVSVALAASTGIILAFTRDPENWRPFDSIRVLLLLTTSLSTAVFALLPFVLFAAGLSDTAVWRLSSAVLAVFPVGQFGILTARARALEPFEREHFRLWVAVPVLTVGGLNLIAQVLNAIGVVFSGGPAVVLAGLLWGVVLASLIFVLLIFRRPRTTP